MMIALHEFKTIKAELEASTVWLTMAWFWSKARALSRSAGLPALQKECLPAPPVQGWQL